MGVLVTGISKGMSSAILADASQQAANDTNTEIPTDVKHEEQGFQKSLQPYLGTWYVSNADGSAAFSSAEYAQNEEFAIYGLKLEIVPIKGSYYARLTSNIHPFDYGFTERTLNGDSLLPITQTGDASWSISFDEIDESNASNVVRGTSKLILTINTVGDLYIGRQDFLSAKKKTQDLKTGLGQFQAILTDNVFCLEGFIHRRSPP